MMLRKILFAAAFSTGLLSAQDLVVPIRINMQDHLGPMDIDRFGVGQGGMSPEPMWSERVAEVRILKPRLIRLFVQEYFNLLPARGRYNFETLDRSVDLILRTGAKPLLCITFKPKVLFPEINQDVVEPSSWEDWEALIYNLVRHYRDRGGRGWYWEVSNEPDLQTGGGTPYHFTPENYPRFYQRTVSAILRADPEARVGGPALANWRAAILPALLAYCEANKVPLHFVSWHGYTNDPMFFRKSIEGVKELLAKHPGLRPETIIDEWNMALGVSVVDPRFQPCFIAETTYQMKEAGLDLSCYYHIRDYHLAVAEFLRFYPRQHTMRERLFWDRRPLYLGMFDVQNRIRPAYFLMKAMSRLTGTRLRVESPSPAVHGLAAEDEEINTTSLLVWNFSKFPAQAALEVSNAPGDILARTFVLDSTGPSDDDTARLRPLQPLAIKGGTVKLALDLEPYGVTFVSMEARR
jgi:hypothetical protein